MTGYSRARYILAYNGEEILSCDAAITPPFTVGEVVVFEPEAHDEQLGTFIVDQITRRIPYYTTISDPPMRIPLVGQEVCVHLRAMEMGEGI